MSALDVLTSCKHAAIEVYDRIYYSIRLLGRPDICFVWVPKSAGSSIFRMMEREVGMVKLKDPKKLVAFPNYGPVTFGHVHYHSLQRMGVISKAYHDSSLKFAVVRNPYDRVVSLYNYLVQIEIYQGDFDAFLDDLLLRRPSVGVYNMSWISVGNPQTDWLIGGDGAFVVDRVFKLEEIDKFYDFLKERGFNPGDQIPHENRSSGTIGWQKDLIRSERRLAIVNSIYYRDFELLGYDMISSAPQPDNLT